MNDKFTLYLGVVVILSGIYFLLKTEVFHDDDRLAAACDADPECSREATLKTEATLRAQGYDRQADMMESASGRSAP